MTKDATTIAVIQPTVTEQNTFTILILISLQILTVLIVISDKFYKIGQTNDASILHIKMTQYYKQLMLPEDGLML